MFFRYFPRSFMCMGVCIYSVTYSSIVSRMMMVFPPSFKTYNSNNNNNDIKKGKNKEKITGGILQRCVLIRMLLFTMFFSFFLFWFWLCLFFFYIFIYVLVLLLLNILVCLDIYVHLSWERNFLMHSVHTSRNTELACLQIEGDENYRNFFI